MAKINKKENNYISLPELAKILGISRIAVYKKVKKGEIKAVKIGGNYAVPMGRILGAGEGLTLPTAEKKEIEKAVKKTVSEYGEVLKKLGRE